MIAVRVLGPMEVTVNGALVSVGGPRQRGVLARLIAARGQVVSVDRIIEDLYAGQAPPGAHAAVQSYVSRLRRALEPGRAAWAHAEVLVSSAPGYAACLGDGAVDAWSFEEEVRGAAEVADPAAVHARLSAALGSWRGAAFEEFGGLAWADQEASRLAELRLTAEQARADAALRLGWAASAVADLERLTAEQPLREEAWRLLAVLAARQPARIALGGLDEAAAGELIRVTCARPVADALVRTISRRTGGNPFFLVETARMLDSDKNERAATGVPAGIREVLRHRIAGLPATAQALLAQASVIGTEADVSVLGEIAGLEESVLLDAIDAALHSGLVTEPAPGRIRFAHALVRDVLHDSLSRLRRVRLHAQIAAAIERHNPGDVSALAHHFAAAGTSPAKAARYCGLAAGQAEQRFAFHEAARLREQALVLLDQPNPAERGDHGADPRERLELVLSLIRALSHSGQLAIAGPLRRHAVRAAVRLNDPPLLARAITALDVPRVLFFREYGETDYELVGVAERLLRELPPGDHPLRCRLLTTLAIELEDAATARGPDASAQAVAMARALGDPALLATSLIARWAQSFRSGGPDDRLRIGGELLTVSGKPATAEAAAQAMLMAASCGTADFRAADWHAAEAARIAGRYRLPTIEAAVGLYRAMRTALNGDPAARERYREAAGQLGRFGLRVHAVAVDAVAASALLITQGRAAEIAAEPFLADWFPELYALGLAAAGHPAEARAAAGPMLPVPRDRLWLFATGVRGLLGIAAGDRERAGSAYAALQPYAGQPVGAESLLITLWPAAQILGDLARYLGLPAAEAHYGAARAIAERAGVPLWRDAAASRLR